MKLNNIISYKNIKLHKNKIIISIIFILVGILLYRWYINSSSKEGFNSSENILNTKEISTYNYLWSNNLYLSRFQPNNQPENLLILLEPKNNSNDTHKLLGHVLTNNEDKMNITTTIVNKDIKPPKDIKEIVKITDVSPGLLLNEYVSSPKLVKNIEYYNLLNDNINNILKDIENIFYKVVNNVRNNINITLYKNTLNDVEKKDYNLLYDEEQNNLFIEIKNVNINALTFPAGSNVKMIFNDGTVESINIPSNNMKKANGEFNDDITYNEFLKNTELDQHSYNPFGGSYMK